MATRQLENLSNIMCFSTNGYKVIHRLVNQDLVVDKVVIFNDIQMRQHWSQLLFRDNLSPHAKLNLFDLRGYSLQPLLRLEPDVYLMLWWAGATACSECPPPSTGEWMPSATSTRRRLESSCFEKT